MRFTLVYDGDLPASGNKSKPKPVWAIRNHLSLQLDELWEKHRALKYLREEAWRPRKPGDYPWYSAVRGDGPAHRREIPADWENCCAPIEIEGRQYVPLVRSSLHLVCSLGITFLRGEEPGSLILQGGDLDNRLKTLLDGLRMPAVGEHKAGAPIRDPLHCLLESDTLISAINVKTDRYLGATSANPHAVRLIIEVQTQVLEADPITTAFLAD